jgi:hypothetical protein
VVCGSEGAWLPPDAPHHWHCTVRLPSPQRQTGRKRKRRKRRKNRRKRMKKRR